MRDRLNDELHEVKAEAAVATSGAFEAAVWRRIAAVREARSAASIFVPVRAATVVAALGVGIAAGGFSAAVAMGEPQEVSVFSPQSRLTPLALLDGHG